MENNEFLAKQNPLRQALDNLIACLTDEQTKIGIELEQRINPDVVEIINGNSANYGSRGIKNEENDFRCYHWIGIRIDDRIYWITLFYNDINEANGNPRTQFGKIQFWKNVNPWNSKPGSPHATCDSGHWYFDENNMGKTDLKIYAPDYSTKRVVEEFLTFLEDNNEVNVRKI